jgi:hypothetical protein
MRVRVLFRRRQVIVFQKPLVVLLAGFALLFSCERSSGEVPLVPPPTHPLVRDFIGYGVVNTSFAHIMSEPGREGLSPGYLRKGSLVKIIERRSLTTRGNLEFWVFIDGASQDTSEPGPAGWLNESAVDVYDNKAKALTASELMIR